MWLDSLSTGQRRALFGLAHNVVVSDGLLDPNEERMMNQFRREMELLPDVEAEYLPIDGMEQVFDSPRSRTIALLNLIHLSYSDGAFEIEEECFLRELSKQLGVNDEQFLLLDNWIRRLMALEEEASSLLR